MYLYAYTCMSYMNIYKVFLSGLFYIAFMFISAFIFAFKVKSTIFNV